MTLVQPIHASPPARPPASRDPIQFLEMARVRNAQPGVTSVPCFTGRSLVQVLEGGRDAVCETFYRIARDERHGDVRLLASPYPPDRGVPAWTMGFVGMGEIPPALVRRRDVTDGAPDRLGEDATLATAFLQDVAGQPSTERSAAALAAPIRSSSSRRAAASSALSRFASRYKARRSSPRSRSKVSNAGTHS